MLYQPSIRKIVQIDKQFFASHPRGVYKTGVILYEDHSVFTNFNADNATPYSINFCRNIFSDERGYWVRLTDEEIKRMRIEEARDGNERNNPEKCNRKSLQVINPEWFGLPKPNWMK